MRIPLSAGDLVGMRADGSTLGMSIDLMPKVIQAWSYDAPITTETVESLDIDTFTFLTKAIMAESGIRTEEEKKDSESPPSGSPQTAESPPSLVTSQ